ncbi:cation:proton antiporter [Haloarchaeobius sp. DFWS5]|uniref:cation:proton antiporter n=1 Tax=Haloarchaeobius sp. DFWS5 TaxID=3446114 RepID=UPI003EBE0278
MSGVEELLLQLLYLFAIAGVVGILSKRYPRLQYTTGLLLAGLLVSILGSPVEVELTSDFILLAILPALIFNDAINIDLAVFRENLVPILALAVVGLLVSIALIAVVGATLFGFSLAIAVLFGAIIMPTDPVSVLAVFEDLGVPERLSILVEGESLLNDGVSIVVYSTVLAVVVEAESQGVETTAIVTPSGFLADVGVGILGALVGGAVLGATAGFVAHELIATVDDELTAVAASVLVAYGVYLLLDLLGSSGVIGTLTAGVFLAARQGPTGISPETRFTVETVWGYAALVANTLIFVAIGIVTPFDLLLSYAPQIVAAIVVVFLARAVVVYPLVGLLNRWLDDSVSFAYQHVLSWSGIHASTSIALVLGVSETYSGPLAEQLSALVFGVAACTLLVNGTTMGRLIDRLGISTQRPPQRLYQALVGRLHGVDAALETAARLHENDELSTSVFDDVTAVYRQERTELVAAIESLLDRYPSIREHEEHLAQHRILVAEHGAIREAIQRGEISSRVGDRLLEDVDSDLGRALAGEWDLTESRSSGPEPFWRRQLAEVERDQKGTRDRDEDESAARPRR